MKKVYVLLVGCWIGLTVTALIDVSPAAAKNRANIENLTVTPNQDNLEVSFTIQNCFTPKMEEAIWSGVPTTFRIRLVVDKRGFRILRGPFLNTVLEHTIKYDRLKNEFQVNLPEYPDSLHVTSDFEEAKRWMSTVNQVPVIPLWRLQKGQTYQVRVKAELSKVHLPLFFRYIFFFVSLWDFETDWYKVSFSL